MLDPYHIITGAPWAYPWSVSQYGDDGGYLALDLMQVENYIAEPAYHQTGAVKPSGGGAASVLPAWDAIMRRGLFWEPIANSPPSYILEGDDGATGKDVGGEPMPPQLESTLSWLGALDFGAGENCTPVHPPI